MSDVVGIHDRTARLEPLAVLSAAQQSAVFGAEVVVAVGAGELGTHVGRVLLETTVELLQRTVRAVMVMLDPRASENERSVMVRIASGLADVGGRRPRTIPWDSVPTSKLCVALGVVHPVPAERFIGVGADGWSGTVYRDAVAPIEDSTWPIGACTAAALCQAAVVQHLLAQTSSRPPIGPLGDDGVAIVDMLTWSTGVSAGPRRAVVSPTTLPEISIVGAGAVGHALAWVLRRAPVRARMLHWFDDGQIDETSLNRCLGACVSDIGRAKLDIITRQLLYADIHVNAVPQLWTPARALAPLVASAVDNNAVRHDIQKMLPEVLLSGETFDASAAVGRHVVGNGLACLICRHPRRETGAPVRQSLLLEEAATKFSLPISAFAEGTFNGGRVLTAELAEHLARLAPEQAAALRDGAQRGVDLCGALGDLREAYGSDPSVPATASFGASSLLAGIGLVSALVREPASHADLALSVFELDLFGPITPLRQPGHRRVPRARQCPGCGEIAQRLARGLRRTNA